MKNFWVWYNRLQEPYRFLLFMGLASFCMGVLPMLSLWYTGSFVIGQMSGVTIMTALAMSKVFGWPDWPKKRG